MLEIRNNGFDTFLKDVVIGRIKNMQANSVELI